MSTSSAKIPHKDAQHIMERLSVDFAAETKLSCRDCLRSKAMPCPQVQTLLEEVQQQQQQQHGTTSKKSALSINVGILMEAQDLMKQILGVSGSTALFQINKMATAIRFLQLLLSLPHKTPLQQQQQQQHQQPSNNSAPTTDASISVDRLDQLIQTSVTDLVQAVSQLQTAWAQNRRMCSSDNDDETPVVDVLTMDASQTHSDARPVACFVFVSISRLQVFGKRRQQWMIPLCRALCDLALTSNQIQAPLPTSLVEDAIRSMNQLLEEGCILLTNDAVTRWMPSEKGVSETQETLLELSHHSFFSKFLSFLIARITSLLPLLRDSESSSPTAAVVSSSCRVMTLLRGLPWLLTHLHRTRGGRPVADAMGCLRNHGDMAEKLEKQLLKVLWNKKATEDRIHPSLLGALLHEKVKRKSASTPLQDLIRRGRIWGRALLLQKLLARVYDETFVKDGLTRETELLLKLCEVYHAVVLPECFGILAAASFDDGSEQNEDAHNLIAAPLQHMTTLLMRVESSMRATDASKCAQLHRLVLRWLAGFSCDPCDSTSSPSSGHPLTTQFVSSLIYLYSINGYVEQQTPALALLMIKVLFDARTKTAFRRNIAAVLNRMLASTHQLSKILGSLVETEFVRVWKEEYLNLQKKRKRKKSTMGAYGMGDVEVIGDILSTLRCHESSSLQDTVKSFIEGGRFSRRDGLNNHTHVKSISLLIRYMEGAISGSISTSGWLSDSERSKVLQQLVELALAELSEEVSKRDIHMPLLLSITSIFRVACAHAIPSVPLKSLCQLLALCTRANRSPSHEPLLLEGTEMLGFLAGSISESCSKEILESIRSIFIQTLSSQDLIVVRVALGSLVRFGHGLHERHASLLPTFLPAHRVPLFQARAQGLVWTLSGICKVRTDLEHFEVFGRSLAFLVHPRRLEKSIFPILNSFHISCGSFYLQMPTREGRQAIVLFPPGEQSLEDIRHMHEIQDGEDLPNVQVLQRVVMTNNLRGGEGGCKFYLEPYR